MAVMRKPRKSDITFGVYVTSRFQDFLPEVLKKFLCLVISILYIL